jgi:hypothetical protein
MRGYTMTVTFESDQDMILVTLRGKMGYEQKDWDMVKQMVAELERHFTAGARTYLIDARDGTFVFPASVADFLTPWLTILARGARVAFLVTENSTRLRIFAAQGSIDGFSQLEEAIAFLRSRVPTSMARLRETSGILGIPPQQQE